jgi:hypothetical protein
LPAVKRRIAKILFAVRDGGRSGIVDAEAESRFSNTGPEGSFRAS